jgi:hypothetical protein
LQISLHSGQTGNKILCSFEKIPCYNRPGNVPKKCLNQKGFRGKISLNCSKIVKFPPGFPAEPGKPGDGFASDCLIQQPGGTKGLLMAFKLLDMAQQRWRRLDGAALLLLVRAGVKCVDGLQKQTTRTTA